MIPRTSRSTLTDTLFPHTTLFRSTPVEWRSYVRKGIEAWNDVFHRLGYPDAIVAKQLPDGFNDYDDVRYTVLCWASWYQDKGNKEKSGCSSIHIYDPRSGELIQQRITTGGLRSEEHTSELQSLMRISYAVFC